MELQLLFGRAENGSATAKMAIDGGIQEDFDYVKLVKLLFDNPEATVAAEVAESYNDAQKQRLNELVDKIMTAAKGKADTAQTLAADDLEPEDIPI